MLYLIWNYKYTPVIVIPEKWLHPFGTTVRWPTDTVGGISIALWVAVTGTVARMAAASLKSLK
jgi:hypothetical protein